MDFQTQLAFYGQQVVSAIAALALAAIATLLTKYAPKAIALWTSASANKVFQAAVLWASKEAVARLRNDGDTGVETETAAIDAATKAVEARIPDTLKAVGVIVTDQLRARVASRVLDLIHNGVSK
jgi:hypothetical protein